MTKRSKRLTFFLIPAVAFAMAAVLVSAGIRWWQTPAEGRRDIQSHASPDTTRNARPRRDSPVDVASLFKRFRLAESYGTTDEVYRKIVSELKQFDADHILAMLAEVDSASDDGDVRSRVRAALFNALCGIDRGLACEYTISAPADNSFQYQAAANFDFWESEDSTKLIAWVDAHEKELSASGFLFNQAQVAAVSRLLKEDAAAAMERVKGLPAAQVGAIVSGVIGRNDNLFPPDQAIGFLREAMSRTGHEEILGKACGPQLYKEDESALQAFFRRHDTTREEGEAILFQSVKMDMQMGLGEDPIDAFHKRMRDLAEAEGFGNANDLTAVILGIRSDRDHEDKRAVDELLSYDPDASALMIFLGERGKSIDADQRDRITERLPVPSSLSPQ